jgi:CRISPR-associated endonuclease Csn1
MIVSFKQNLRVINKTVNKFEHYDENGKKKMVKQVKGDSWAIRKSIHKDTGWGEINLRFTKEVSLNEALKNPKSIVNKDFKRRVQELLAQGHDAKYIKKYVEDNQDVWSDIDIKKIKVYYFTKETNDRYFATRFLSDLVGYMSGIKDSDKAIAKIEGITDTGIQKILKAHLQAKGNNPEIAFSADGIDEMNSNIVELNGGKPHKPIYKVRRYESGNKYSIGQKGCKAKKFVEADKGTNLFFAIFSSEKLNKESGEMESVRSYLTIPLNVMIDCQKKFGSKWQANIETYLKECKLVSDEVKLLFILSPNDLVYLPTKEELKNGVGEVDKKRIYKMVSSSGNQCFFVSERVSSPIVNKVEYSALNKMERAITDEMIKETCLPLKVDRLGNIISLGY